MKNQKRILVINAGSATLKFKVFDFSNDKFLEKISGIIERIGLSNSFIKYQCGREEKIIKNKIKNHQQAFKILMRELGDFFNDINFVGHRVVHGGEDFVKPTVLNRANLKKLEKYNNLAPLHNPVNLSCIKSSLKIFPRAKQMGVFDTAYYETVPDYAYLYPLPITMYQKHNIRRYGFHGTSHKYSAVEGCKKSKINLKKAKVITCHLGSGCSITATKDGQAIATSMGFTPLEGLMMSTRCGDIDPAILIFMNQKLKIKISEIDNILNKKSGLLGIAGTMDMREILAGAGKRVVDYKVKNKFTTRQKKLYKLALKMFIYNIQRYVGQYYVAMGGLDLLVFTGGVGERSPVIRQMVKGGIKPLGRFKSVVVDANEELMIAKEILNK